MAATILVCDDEAHIRHIIAHKLKGAGFTVVEARNGQEALTLLDQGGRPDLVISDFQMPLITGLELCKVMRQRTDTSAVPVVMLTARGYILTDEELAQTNIRKVISKPFGVRQLLELVVEMLTAKDPTLVPEPARQLKPISGNQGAAAA
jgi:CheY-like chemotaxis protein